MITTTAGVSQACVGRILYIGATKTTESETMAELLVMLINERTGTNVKIKYFDDRNAIYQAFKSDEEETRVDIIVENTAAAMAYLGRKRLAEPDREYLEVKRIYEEKLGVIWLKPFGFTNHQGEEIPSVSAPLIRNDVLTNYPLLPRILTKLSGAIDDETFRGMIARITAGEKAKNVARDFLKAGKFI
ncbi:MAG: glycine betaine ABC transporter substrate-binding protein [Desulfobulbales bacterium]|nr:glycine betaine ABC transporter substrate-binding protein [Desulfobulbales bacterium]